jgi:hypothetical protein
VSAGPTVGRHTGSTRWRARSTRGRHGLACLPARFLHEHLASASPDLLRQMLTTFINTLMSAEADAICGAAYGLA